MTEDTPEEGLNAIPSAFELPPLTFTYVATLTGADAKTSPYLKTALLAQNDGPAKAKNAGAQTGDREVQITKLQEVYNKAIKSPARQQIFHDRMEAIAQYDPKTFADLVKIGDQIASKQLSPEDAGKDIAQAMRDTLSRHGPSNATDLGNNALVAVMGGLSGLMLAERANFDPAQTEELTGKMVDAAEAQLRLHSGADGVMLDHRNNKPITGLRIHGVMWSDDGEPALCAYNHDILDRHKYQIGGY